MASMKDKVVAITGGASGIGLATAKLLSSRGAHVSLADVNKEPLEAAAESIRASGGRALATVVDVRDAAQVSSFIDATVKEYGRLDGAANIAGVTGPNTYKWGVADFATDEWELVMGINSTGVFNCVRKEMQVMADGASIVNAASVLGLRGTAKNVAYVASKHAVVGITKCAALDGGEKGIRVNAVAPGTVDSPMVARIEQTINRDGWLDKMTIKRKAKTEEIANVIAFLLSDDAKYVTGSVYGVDGGWNI